MAIRILTVLALSVILTACGGGGGDSAETQPASSCKSTVKVQLFGDSTFHFNQELTRVYDAQGRSALQVIMDNRFGAGRVTIESRAVPGSIAGDLIRGVDGTNAAWPAPRNADVVAFNFGINDAGRHIPIADYKAQLRAFAAGSGKVLFQTPNPIYGVPDEDLPGPYAAAMKEVAAETGATVADVYSYVNTIPDWHAMLIDYVHPKAELYRQIDMTITGPALGDLVASVICR